MRQRTIVLSLLALAACGRAKTADVPIETAPVERRTIIVDAQATGVIEPINVVEVKSKSSGQIVQMPVEVGTEVRPGDLLVQLDPRDVKNQYDQSAADLAAAQARLEVATSQRKRSQELYDAQIITRQELESSSLEDENAKAALVRARTNLDIAQQRLDEATVRAPVSGTVIDKPVSIGQVIASATGSASGGTTILKMADLNKVRVRALVNESDIGSIQSGLPARVVVDAYPDRAFAGTVEKIEPQAVVEQSVTMFPVLIALSNESGLLKPGMNGEVSVIVSERENVLAIPNDAIRTMRELQMASRTLGLDPDSVQQQLRSQFSGGPPGGDTGSQGGAEVRVARGDVALQPAQGPGQGAATRGGPGREGPPAQGPGAQGEPGQGPAGQGPAAQGGQAGGPQRGGMMRGGQNGGMRGGQNGGGMRGGGQAGGQGGAGPVRSGLVFVKSGSSWTPRMVRLGASDFDFTQVISGVEEGEEVAMLAAAVLQAQRNEQNDRMRSRMSVPGMSRTNQPTGGGPGGGGPGGGPGGGGPGGGGGGGRPPGR